MSHTVFARSTFSNARVWAFLKQVDAAEARVCRTAGCPRCGRVLHSATYPRKPHGLAASLRHDARRFSFCCAAGVVALLRPQVPCGAAVPRGERTDAGWRRAPGGGRPAVGGPLRRWRRWWRESFPATRAWRWKRGELAVPAGEAPLVYLLGVIRGRSVRSRLLRSLIWLLPWTGFCALGAGPALSAESGSSRDG